MAVLTRPRSTASSIIIILYTDIMYYFTYLILKVASTHLPPWYREKDLDYLYIYQEDI